MGLYMMIMIATGFLPHGAVDASWRFPVGMVTLAGLLVTDQLFEWEDPVTMQKVAPRRRLNGSRRNQFQRQTPRLSGALLQEAWLALRWASPFFSRPYASVSGPRPRTPGGAKMQSDIELCPGSQNHSTQFCIRA